MYWKCLEIAVILFRLNRIDKQKLFINTSSSTPGLFYIIVFSHDKSHQASHRVVEKLNWEREKIKAGSIEEKTNAKTDACTVLKLNSIYPNLEVSVNLLAFRKPDLIEFWPSGYLIEFPCIGWLIFPADSI